VCESGIVLAADTQETVGDFEHPIQKLLPVSGTDYAGGIAGSGNGFLVDMVIERMAPAISGLDTRAEIKDAVNQVMLDLYRNEIRVYPVDSESDKEVQLLIAMTSKKEQPILLKVSATAVSTVPEYAVIGIGGLLDYIAQQLYKSGMRLQQGIVVACHLLGEAKERMWAIGGESNVLVITDNAKYDMLLPWKMDDVAEYFRRAAELHRDVVLAGANDNLAEDAYSATLAMFVEGMKRLREQFRKTRPFNVNLDELLKLPRGS